MNIIVHTFIIQGRLPGMNEIVGFLTGKHGKHVYNDKKKAIEEVIGYALLQYRVPEIKRQVNVKINWVEKNRQRDKDNIIAGTKFLLDALVTCHKLKNDGWKEIGSITHTFEIDKQDPRVEVALEEVV